MHITVIKNALSVKECRKIIWRGKILARLWENWHTVEQYSGTVNVKRMFIGRYIRDITKKINFAIPTTVSIELLRYDTGSYNELHIDNRGPHKTDRTLIDKDWVQTGVILLNTDFEGGVLSFPKQGQSFTKDNIGDLLIFPAGSNSIDFAHTVSMIASGIRYSLVMRFVTCL